MEKLNQQQHQNQQQQQRNIQQQYTDNNEQSSSSYPQTQSSHQLDHKYRGGSSGGQYSGGSSHNQLYTHNNNQSASNSFGQGKGQQQQNNQMQLRHIDLTMQKPNSNQAEQTEGGSVIIDSNAVECMERLMLSEPSQKMENCLNTNWQQLEMLVAILQQLPLDQYEDIFTLHVDPKQNNKVILTETQFNLVRKAYMRSFSQGDNKFSLNDDHMITQFFMNLKAMYHRIQRIDSQGLGMLESARKGLTSARKLNKQE
eukprot:403355263